MQPRVRGVSVHSLNQAPCPLHSFFLQKTNLGSLPEKPCPTHTPTFPSSLYLNPWAPLWALTPKFPSGVMSGILQGKATWGKMEKDNKTNKFPLALG